jgi:hypothetical protein
MKSPWGAAKNLKEAIEAWRRDAAWSTDRLALQPRARCPEQQAKPARGRDSSSNGAAGSKGQHSPPRLVDGRKHGSFEHWYERLELSERMLSLLDPQQSGST